MRAGLIVTVALVSAWAACGFETSDGAVESGNEALVAGRADEAVATYAEAATRLPESPELNYDRGLAASLAGDHASAASLLLQALATKDKALEQKVKSALGTVYAREALVLERTPPAEPDPADAQAEPTMDEGAPQIPAAAMDKWKLAVEFLEDALVLDPQDAEARRTLEVALMRVDPPCATRDDRFEDNDGEGAAKLIEVAVEAPKESQMPGAGPSPEAQQDELRFREQLFSCPDDEDWYAIELAAGDRVELAPTVPKGAGRLRMTLYTPGGEVAWAWTSGGADGAEEAPRHGFTVDVAAAGRWRLRQENVELDEVSYGLEVVVRPACMRVEDRYEENDVVADAKTLTPGPVPDLKRCPGDEDWYALTLAEGESLFLYAQPEGKPEEAEKDEREEGAPPPPPPPFSVEVLDESGAVRARGAPIERSQVSTLLMPGAGRYFVRVFDRAGAEPYEGRYALQVEVVPPCPEGDDRFEDNDEAVMATDLIEAAQPPAPDGQAGQAMPQGGQGPPVVFARVCPGDTDWWKVVSDQQTPQVVSLVFDHAQGDLALELFDEAGLASVARSDQSSPEANGEALAIPIEKPPGGPAAPGGATPGSDAVDPAAPPPEPKTFTIKVSAAPEQQNFYLLRLDNPSGGGGDQGDQGDESEDSEDSKGEDSPPEDGEDEEGEPQDEDRNPLQDAIDNLDRNPENLQARDAARKSPLANQKPAKDW